MDIQRAKHQLDKVTREFGRMTKDPDNVMRIDLDILLAHVREFYDALRSDEPAEEMAAPAPKTAPRPAPQPVPEPMPVIETVKIPPARTIREMPPPAPESSYMPPPPLSPAVASGEGRPPAPKYVEPQPVAPTPAPPPPAPAPQFSGIVSPEAEQLFEQKQARELSEKLAESPIADLRKGIALNDKLLFQAELFGKNQAAFDEALTALNSFTHFEQAKYWLLDHAVEQFNWTDKHHVERAKDFIRLVRRRYK